MTDSNSLPAGEAQREPTAPSSGTDDDIITGNFFELGSRDKHNHAFFTFFCDGETLSAGIAPIRWLESAKVCVLELEQEDGIRQAVIEIDQDSIRTADNPAHRKQVGYPVFSGQMRRYFTGTVRELREGPFPADANPAASSDSPEAKE